ncbi:helix-turn-helix domain-containing protein [Acetobacter persici]|uniref:helix-turn-helix domain-containing protein n=1 Tax=Acetobacter persici TaxID=1076596 RepID=UPI0036DBBCE3
MEKFLTIPAFAGRLNVPLPTAYAWASQGIIPTTEHGGRVWVHEDDLPEISRRYQIYKKFKIKKQEKNTK